MVNATGSAIPRGAETRPGRLRRHLICAAASLAALPAGTAFSSEALSLDSPCPWAAPTTADPHGPSRAPRRTLNSPMHREASAAASSGC